MKRNKPVSSYLYNHRRRPKLNRSFWLVMGLVVLAIGVYWKSTGTSKIITNVQTGLAPQVSSRPGDLVAEGAVQTFTPVETAGLIRENYGAATPAPGAGITKITFRYRSELPGGDQVIVYARAYLPATSASNLPIFAFAPGTTGIGDQCAPSLEKPKVANWANYDSHMAMYASQGYAVVTTDYEGMRDTSRIHHYMVGELEGRAMLDSVRALKHLSEARGRLNPDDVFLAGYSQGGHAAFWGDKIAARYAPDVKPMGIIGYGPVMSVQETLTDVVHGANINWFGPYVLYSYQDFYKGAGYGSVLLPKWQNNLAKDVPAHCIETDIPFWGSNPANVYTPEFLQAARDNTLATQYPALYQDLERNAVGALSTSSAKLINQGGHDNVVLPAQQQAVVPSLCQSSSGPVQLKVYPEATHYTTMLQSARDTINWMQSLARGEPAVSTCS